MATLFKGYLKPLFSIANTPRCRGECYSIPWFAPLYPWSLTRHAGHCWRSRDELISYILLWIPTYGRAKAGRPERIYIQQLREDTGSSPEEMPEAMNDRENVERESGISVLVARQDDEMMMLSNAASSTIFWVSGMTRPWDITLVSRPIGKHSTL